MDVIAERIFSAADQNKFALFSGDANPMHVDAVAARRTVFGAPVVHGIHLICWALDSWFRVHPGPAALTRLTASFNRGVIVDEHVGVAACGESEGVRFVIRHDRADMSSIRVQTGSVAGHAVSPGETLPAAMGIRECREASFEEASRASGSLPLEYSPDAAAELFPHLSASLPAVQIAALLATTRLVGMECPGLHSLYSALDLTFDKFATGKPEMSFRVEHTVPGTGMLRIGVEGRGFRGKLRAFVRPTPLRQAGMHELARLVEKGEFARQRAVIVGGSRGLGEVAAKLLALGGADVAITYRRGQADAEALAAEIDAAGGRCSVMPFDVTAPATASTVQPPTHIYYFATPHISADDSVVFSSRLFDMYCRYYVTGFVETVLSLARDVPDLRIYYPSTIFLNDAAQMPEYCAAKAAGEETCRQLAVRFTGWRVHSSRLPRLLTDQNNGFSAVKAEAPETAILEQLRLLNS